MQCIFTTVPPIIIAEFPRSWSSAGITYTEGRPKAESSPSQVTQLKRWSEMTSVVHLADAALKRRPENLEKAKPEEFNERSVSNVIGWKVAYNVKEGCMSNFISLLVEAIFSHAIGRMDLRTQAGVSNRANHCYILRQRFSDHQSINDRHRSSLLCASHLLIRYTV